MAKGKTKFFHSERGYGFIETPDSLADIFVHVTACSGYLPNRGDSVTFEIVPDKKRPERLRAKNVALMV